MKGNTQEKMILNHLAKYGEITSWEAYDNYGVTRLSAVIYKIKKHGYTIESSIGKAENRFGKPVHFSRYKLVEK